MDQVSDVAAADTSVAVAREVEVADSSVTAPPPAIRIMNVEGKREIEVGEIENYSARLTSSAERPVVFRWSMGDGTEAVGNYISHRYQIQGIYEIIVTARNRKGSASDTMLVTVRHPTADLAPIIEDDDESEPLTGIGDETPSEPVRPPPNAIDAALFGREGIDWKRGGYTLMNSTHSSSGSAEAAALRLRREGYRSGIVLDNSDPGSPVYRVVIGQFSSDQAAADGRRRMLQRNKQGAFIVTSLPLIE